MICPNCGTLVDDNFKHCTQCGSPLEMTFTPDAQAFAPMEQAFDSAEQTFDSAEQAFDSAEQTFDYAEQNFNASEQAYNNAQENFAYADQSFNTMGQQPYNNEPYNPMMPPMPIEDPGKGMGIASLVLGIISMVVCNVIVIPVLGIVFGAIGRKKSKEAGFENKMATAGLILSIIGAVVAVVLPIVIVVLYVVFGAAIFGMSYMYY